MSPWTREKLPLYFPCMSASCLNGKMRALKTLLAKTQFQYLFRQVPPFVLCRNDVINTSKINNIYTLTNSGFLSTDSFFFCIILAGSYFIGKATADIRAP